MNQNQTESKQQDVEEPREEGLDETTYSVFLVICAIDHEGDNVEAVYLDRNSAIRHRDQLNPGRYTFHNYRAEEWKDGATEGHEI